MIERAGTRANKVFRLLSLTGKMEIVEVEDEASLTVLQDAVRGIDSALSDAAAQKIDAIAGRNSAKNINTDDSARVQVGSVLTEAALHREIRVNDQTINEAETVFAKGESGVQIGNIYGGRGLWDRRVWQEPFGLGETESMCLRSLSGQSVMNYRDE